MVVYSILLLFLKLGSLMRFQIVLFCFLDSSFVVIIVSFRIEMVGFVSIYLMGYVEISFGTGWLLFGVVYLLNGSIDTLDNLHNELFSKYNNIIVIGDLIVTYSMYQKLIWPDHLVQDITFQLLRILNLHILI